MNNIDFIEKVFNTKSNKHGFNVFDKKYVNKLEFQSQIDQFNYSVSIEKNIFQLNQKKLSDSWNY